MQMEKTIVQYESVLAESGHKLSAGSRDALRGIIKQLREKMGKRRLKASEWQKYRALRAAAQKICELREPGEPIYGGGSYISTGRVGNSGGHG